MKCEYGCNQEAKFILGNGKSCCSKSSNSCIEVKRKNSEGLKKAYQEGRKQCFPEHFDGKRGWSKGKTMFSDERVNCKHRKNLFTKYSKVDRTTLRKILISEKLIEYKCSECKINEWNGKKLVLELEHKNGINDDNRLENLTFLCPNCHSQTSTWRKAKNPRNRHSKEEFVEALKTSKNIKEALEKLNLTKNGGNLVRAKRILNEMLE